MLQLVVNRAGKFQCVETAREFGEVIQGKLIDIELHNQNLRNNDWYTTYKVEIEYRGERYLYIPTPASVTSFSLIRATWFLRHDVPTSLTIKLQTEKQTTETATLSLIWFRCLATIINPEEESL